MSRRKQSQEPSPTTAPAAQNRTSQRSTRSSKPTFVPNQAPAPSTRRSSNAAPSVPSMLMCCFPLHLRQLELDWLMQEQLCIALRRRRQAILNFIFIPNIRHYRALLKPTSHLKHQLPVWLSNYWGVWMQQPRRWRALGLGGAIEGITVTMKSYLTRRIWLLYPCLDVGGIFNLDLKANPSEDALLFPRPLCIWRI
ncbi:hypothetical protein K438DRAFT_1753521 [Mycena galopus ATCC 62051]|nr:hypothetical protein K438DRAFT_1753521 [Mycena galopus ATCC 62051]